MSENSKWPESSTVSRSSSEPGRALDAGVAPAIERLAADIGTGLAGAARLGDVPLEGVYPSVV